VVGRRPYFGHDAERIRDMPANLAGDTIIIPGIIVSMLNVQSAGVLGCGLCAHSIRRDPRSV
jgi:hypothetical protein